MDTVWKWVPLQSNGALLGYRLRFILMGILLVGLLGLSLLAERRIKKIATDGAAHSGIRIFTFFGLSSLLLVGVLILTYLFTHPTIDVDNRMLLPLFVGSVMSFYVGMGVMAGSLVQRQNAAAPGAAVAGRGVVRGWYIPQTRNEAKSLSRRRWADRLSLEPL